MIEMLIGASVVVVSRFCYNLYRKKQSEREAEKREQERIALLKKANSGDETARQQYNTFDMDR